MDLINCNCCSNSSCSGEAVPEATRAFIATDKPVLSTSQIVEWLHPRPGTDRHHARRSVVASVSAKPMPFPDEVRAKIK